MPQIILKEGTAHLASYTFFTRDVDQYKKRHFRSSVITSFVRHVNIAKFLRTAVL